MPFYLAERTDKCVNCGWCKELLVCAEPCIGCGACYLACPNQAVRMVESSREKKISIIVRNEKYEVPERITVKKALELLGYEIFSPCEVGGCGGCAVKINHEIKPSCITPVEKNMRIDTELPHDYTPKRIVHGFRGHHVGGVGTPWWLKDAQGYIEVVCFAAGCNFRCPQCQNWTTTYCGKGKPLTPKETAQLMSRSRRKYNVDRMAISGGESTLNRRWLTQYIKKLKKLNPDKDARIHVDTNASLLTPDYIDELVEAGMTDIGADLKALELDTFTKITGLREKKVAQKYLKNSWAAVKYLVDNYADKVFIGVGFPYNKDLITVDEITKMGESIGKLDAELQVCVLDYRPEFRRTSISRPNYDEMRKIWKRLRDVGLRRVICQTRYGHIGPKNP